MTIQQSLRHNRTAQMWLAHSYSLSNGIPDAIYFQAGYHTQPISGDHGIRYAKRKEATT